MNSVTSSTRSRADATPAISSHNASNSAATAAAAMLSRVNPLTMFEGERVATAHGHATR